MLNWVKKFGQDLTRKAFKLKNKQKQTNKQKNTPHSRGRILNHDSILSLCQILRNRQRSPSIKKEKAAPLSMVGSNPFIIQDLNHPQIEISKTGIWHPRYTNRAHLHLPNFEGKNDKCWDFMPPLN